MPSNSRPGPPSFPHLRLWGNHYFFQNLIRRTHPFLHSWNPSPSPYPRLPGRPAQGPKAAQRGAAPARPPGTSRLHVSPALSTSRLPLPPPPLGGAPPTLGLAEVQGVVGDRNAGRLPWVDLSTRVEVALLFAGSGPLFCLPASQSSGWQQEEQQRQQQQPSAPATGRRRRS